MGTRESLSASRRAASLWTACILDGFARKYPAALTAATANIAEYSKGRKQNMHSLHYVNPNVSKGFELIRSSEGFTTASFPSP